MHYLEHPAIPLLPGGIFYYTVRYFRYFIVHFRHFLYLFDSQDIVVIPRSSSVLRMVYRNMYGVDFRISATGIFIDDASEVEHLKILL